MDNLNNNEIRELDVNELKDVTGGNPAYIAIAAGAGYLAILDSAWSFGKGLGAGMYDALH
ncbi:MAG: hypothetical protein ACPG52_07770 [Cognaticolwellia sp.]